MVQISLECAIVGQTGTFDVKIDDGNKVSELKDAIKEKSGNTFKNIDADDLVLFLAKKDKGNGTWLTQGDVASVRDDLVSQDYKLMQPTLFLKNADNFGAGFQPGEGQIHVLMVPSYAEVIQGAKLSTLAMLLKQCDVSGDLPQQGEFLELFDWTDGDCGKVIDIKRIDDIVHFTGSKFYVRKEILHVLENFMSVYRDEFEEDKKVNKQFILMGSPGTGKSCILALICFYIAVHYKRPVVWFRKGGGRYPAATRLFYKGKYYEWDDARGKNFESLYDALKTSGISPLKCWFCLDGMFEHEIKEKNWRNMYKLLATFGEFWPKSEAMQFTKKCLVPYWKQRDLEDFGLNHLQMQKSDVDARYFVSGGSLRDFLGDNGKATIRIVVAEIAGTGDAKILLRTFGVVSTRLIDCIRMKGVQDVNNTEHYVDTDNWRCCVTSKFALQRLVEMVKPSFFEKLMEIAKEMNDDRVEDYCKYDNVDRTKAQDWETIMGKEDLIEVSEVLVKPSMTKCEGGNRRECVKVVESWAADPSTMDYWIPATSLCETIDAVARWTLSDGVDGFASCS
ncbi:hypothetical protein V7S43_009695 [Phytophthora oleae]|uniref:Crinkler effector protein N-terminal domain-containing protein n=1 Tax=Phytophthora oleae TaxID=2107226 RepID=A0ABD3FF89_9STRA